MSSRTFDEMDRLFEQLDRQFAEMRRRMLNDRSGAGIDTRAGIEARSDRPTLWANREVTGIESVGFDVEEGEDGYTLLADVPGFERDELDLSVEDGVLHLSAVHEVSDDHGTRSRRVDERVTIPGDADGEAASATYRNGVLEVTMPFTADHDEGKRIDVD